MTKVVKKISELRKTLLEYYKKGKSVGFVPTMGALHIGHLELIKKAKQQNDIVVVSIFVNPLQFGPKEDFNKYPRPIKQDIYLCKKQKVNFIFIPTVKEMYPEGKSSTKIHINKYCNILCDRFRPGHFDGVATVVAKLFNIVRPTKAYFGEKDYQQLLIVKQLVNDLNFDIKIIACPIVREKDGVACSSRNKYLKKQERKFANVIYKSLLYCKQLILSRNFKISDCISKSKIFINSHINVPHKIQYFEVYDENLIPVYNNPKNILPGTKIRIFIAVYIGKTRLIDNIGFVM